MTKVTKKEIAGVKVQSLIKRNVTSLKYLLCSLVIQFNEMKRKS